MSTDLNLLFGVLALQADFIDAQQFAEACSAWAARKPTPLAELLVERGWLSAEDRTAIERLMERKLLKHAGDARASIAAAATNQVKLVLADVEDPEIQQTLATMPPPAPSQVATVFYDRTSHERFTLNALHAKGGMGQVWRARDNAIGREIALKEIHPENASHPEMVARFLAEAKITGQLEHPGIVPVYEIGKTADGRQFYAMKFIKGRTMAEALALLHQATTDRVQKRIGTGMLLGAFISVCHAMAYAHSRGVIHRDLKPHNVVLGEYGEVIVIDWGLARTLPGDDVVGRTQLVAAWGVLDLDNHEWFSPIGDLDEQVQSVDGQVLGTPKYMSPEQAEGRTDLVDHRSDIYSLGVILYEILVGKPPFEGKGVDEVLRAVIQATPAAPRTLAPSVTPALEAVCLKALSKKREDRYASALSLSHAVANALSGVPASAYREPMAGRAWRFLKMDVTATGMVNLISTVFLILIGASLGAFLVLVSTRRH